MRCEVALKWFTPWFQGLNCGYKRDEGHGSYHCGVIYLRERAIKDNGSSDRHSHFVGGEVVVNLVHAGCIRTKSSTPLEHWTENLQQGAAHALCDLAIIEA